MKSKVVVALIVFTIYSTTLNAMDDTSDHANNFITDNLILNKLLWSDTQGRSTELIKERLKNHRLSAVARLKNHLRLAKMRQLCSITINLDDTHRSFGRLFSKIFLLDENLVHIETEIFFKGSNLFKPFEKEYGLTAAYVRDDHTECTKIDHGDDTVTWSCITTIPHEKLIDHWSKFLEK